jgi:hypothetical protein
VDEMAGISHICRYLEHLLKPTRRNRTRHGTDRHVGLQIHRRGDPMRPGGESDGAAPDRRVIGGPENFLPEKVCESGVAQLFAPLNGRVEQVRPPVDPSTSPATLSIAGITPPSTLDSATTSAPVTTASSEPSRNVTAEVTSESDAPTLTTAPTSAGTSRTTSKNSFAPSRLTPTATRTSESEESTTTTTSSSTATSTRTSSSTSTTTTTSDPIE